MWTAWKGHTEVIRELFAHHCLLDISTTGGEETEDCLGADFSPGMTPLMIAAREGQKDAVAVLLSCGADPLAMDEDGMTAHAIATENDHADVYAMLSVPEL